uniref:Uncharacterized protein n=2 Tax=Lygus hesperus TaxID=30085 RepID=A0A0A9WI44_LYGHE
MPLNLVLMMLDLAILLCILGCLPSVVLEAGFLKNIQYWLAPQKPKWGIFHLVCIRSVNDVMLHPPPKSKNIYIKPSNRPLRHIGDKEVIRRLVAESWAGKPNAYHRSRTNVFLQWWNDWTLDNETMLLPCFRMN